MLHIRSSSIRHYKSMFLNKLYFNFASQFPLHLSSVMKINLGQSGQVVLIGIKLFHREYHKKCPHGRICVKISYKSSEKKHMLELLARRSSWSIYNRIPLVLPGVSIFYLTRVRKGIRRARASAWFRVLAWKRAEILTSWPGGGGVATLYT